MRDSQRPKVYEADRQMSRYLGAERIPLESLELWIMRFTSSREFRSLYPRTAKRVTVEAKRGGGADASYRSGVLRFSWYSTDLQTALHELAHLATYETLGSGAGRDYAHHGWEFAAHLLTLYRMAWGRGAQERAREIFDALGVRYLPPPEKKERKALDPEVAAQRAAKARATREAKRGYRVTKEPGVFRGMRGQENRAYEVSAHDPDTCLQFSDHFIAWTLAQARKRAHEICKRRAIGAQRVVVTIEAECRDYGDEAEVWRAEDSSYGS